MDPKADYSGWYDQSLPRQAAPEPPAPETAADAAASRLPVILPPPESPLRTPVLPPPPAPEQPSGPEPKPKRRRTGAVAGGITILVLVLIAASVYLASGSLTLNGVAPQDRGDSARPSQTLPLPSGTPERNFEDDFRDFFEEYYSGYEEEESSESSRMTRVAGDPEVRIELQSRTDEPEKSLQEIYTGSVDWVVGVKGYQESLSIGAYNWGSGIVLTAGGYIVTNQHIIGGCDRAGVVLSDGSEYAAELIGEDIQTDLAVLRIRARGLTPAVFGDSGELSVGDRVAAIGNPLGDQYTGTMTDGIISAIDRSVQTSGRSMTLLQTNAALNEGNSGGPLLNSMGQVVGVTNMKLVNRGYSSVTIEGMGFAIPSATVRNVVNQLIASGEVRGRPVMGITVGQVPAEAKEHYALPDGLYIVKVSKGSGAEAAGVLPGDVLTHINGQEVLTTADVLAVRDSLQVGDSMVLTLWREGETLELTVVLGDINDSQ